MQCLTRQAACAAAAVFVAMSYAFMYGSMGDRVMSLFARRPRQEELPSFKKVNMQQATRMQQHPVPFVLLLPSHGAHIARMHAGAERH